MLTQILFAEQSEASLFCMVMRSIDFSPYGRRPLVRYAHREHLLMFSLRYGQDDKFAKKISCG